ncbi:unnamed protein product, partial [Prorocentrum cordatum]
RAHGPRCAAAGAGAAARGKRARAAAAGPSAFAEAPGAAHGAGPPGGGAEGRLCEGLRSSRVQEKPQRPGQVRGREVRDPDADAPAARPVLQGRRRLLRRQEPREGLEFLLGAARGVRGQVPAPLRRAPGVRWLLLRGPRLDVRPPPRKEGQEPARRGGRPSRARRASAFTVDLHGEDARFSKLALLRILPFRPLLGRCRAFARAPLAESRDGLPGPLHPSRASLFRGRIGISMNFRRSAWTSWICSEPPCLARGARQTRRRRRRRGAP